MKNLRKLTLVFLALMFVLPALVQFGAVNSTAIIEPTKNYTESYVHHDQIWIQSNEEFSIQAAAESWAGDGSEETPYVITGYLFDCATQPLRIWHTTVHWIFTGNEIFGVGGPILCGSWVENVTNGAIIDNEVHAGLAIAGVENFIISGNYIHDCWGRGIELFGSMNSTVIKDNVIDNIGQEGIYSVTSRDCVVENNTISNCASTGITLVGETPNCTITDNDITHCEYSGILIGNLEEGEITDNTISNVGSQGIYCSGFIESDISGNTITDVSRSGLKIAAAEFCDISENVIENCGEEGLLLRSGTNNTVEWNSITNASGYSVNLETSSTFYSVMYNTFTECGETCQVNDHGISNVVSYNFYDDWSSPDADADGYVDTPYALDGDAENHDALPLAVAGVVPTVTTSTTTTSTIETPLPMDMLLIAGAVGVIVLVGVVILVKRK